MMQTVANTVFVAVALLAALQGSVSAEHFPVEDYLRTPDTGAGWNLWIVGVLKHLETPEGASSTEVLNKMHEKNQTATHYTETVSYTRLFAALESEGQCSEDVTYTRSALKSILAEEADLSRFADVVQELGGARAKSCAESAEASFASVGASFESIMDQVFGAALDIESAGDAERVQKLQTFDPLNDSFDVQKMAEAAKPYTAEEQMEAPAAKIVHFFLQRHCVNQLPEDVDETLELVNVAAAYGVYELKDVRMQKLNEYRRICLNFDQNDVRRRRNAFEQNLQRQSQ